MISDGVKSGWLFFLAIFSLYLSIYSAHSLNNIVLAKIFLLLCPSLLLVSQPFELKADKEIEKNAPFDWTREVE